MTSTRTRLPIYLQGYQLAQGAPRIMLDGMEVLFDRTVGFYPVRVEPAPAPAPAPAAGNGHRPGNGHSAPGGR